LHSADAGRPITLSPEAEQALLGYSWPGNVRELQNVIERAVVMSGAEVLTPEAFALEGVVPEPFEEAGQGDEEPDFARAAVSATAPSAAGAPAAAAPEDTGTLQECLDRAASERIKAALQSAGGNRVEAAAALGVDRTTLYRLMKRLGL
jgi:DNA-binding NtrC family response regulator